MNVQQLEEQLAQEAGENFRLKTDYEKVKSDFLSKVEQVTQLKSLNKEEKKQWQKVFVEQEKKFEVEKIENEQKHNQKIIENLLK